MLKKASFFVFSKRLTTRKGLPECRGPFLCAEHYATEMDCAADAAFSSSFLTVSEAESSKTSSPLRKSKKPSVKLALFRVFNTVLLSTVMSFAERTSHKIATSRAMLELTLTLNLLLITVTILFK